MSCSVYRKRERKKGGLERIICGLEQRKAERTGPVCNKMKYTRGYFFIPGNCLPACCYNIRGYSMWSLALVDEYR